MNIDGVGANTCTNVAASTEQQATGEVGKENPIVAIEGGGDSACTNVSEETMDESLHPSASTQISGENVSNLSPAISKQSIFTIVLDLNGLLFMRRQQPSTIHESLEYSANKHIVLRPGCIAFLKAILGRFNVGIWSTASSHNILQMLRVLQNKTGEALHFFAIWTQDTCYVSTNPKFFRPDNPDVQAMFKPLAKIAVGYECDPRRTVLIDDSPYKGCVSPANNCIFPSKFDDEKMDDNVLLGELLPYLLQLDENEDLRAFIESNRYGQPPIPIDEYKNAREHFNILNEKWSSNTSINTIRLPIAEQLRDICELHKESASSRTDKRKEEIKRTMESEDMSVESMKAPKLILLARKLGCSTPNLKGPQAKAFINRTLNEFGLLKIAKKR